MKTLKLDAMEQKRLNAKEMNELRGGKTVCGCGCQYEGKGGSAFVDNALVLMR